MNWIAVWGGFLAGFLCGLIFVKQSYERGWKNAAELLRAKPGLEGTVK